MEALLIASALALGVLLVLQQGANVQLSAALGSPAGASAAQLAIGTGALLALAALVGALGAFDRLGSADAWHLAGGLASALYIAAGIVLLPRLGALTTVGLFIAGQMVTSLAVDAAGALGVAQQPLGVAGALGGAAVLAGAGLIARTGAAGGGAERRPAWIALGLAAGAGLALQGPVNAQLRADLDTPVAAGAFSFLVATAAMTAVFAALRGARRVPPLRAPATGMPWWGWLGGFVGAAYVTSVPVLIPEIGVAATIGLTVAGQQLASLAVDRAGLLRLPRRALSAQRLAGVALLLAGVAAVQLA